MPWYVCVRGIFTHLIISVALHVVIGYDGDMSKWWAYDGG